MTRGIDITKLTPDDLDREVEYRGHTDIFFGKITSWNGTYVFVHFDGDRAPKACAPQVIEFTGDPKP